MWFIYNSVQASIIINIKSTSARREKRWQFCGDSLGCGICVNVTFTGTTLALSSANCQTYGSTSLRHDTASCYSPNTSQDQLRRWQWAQGFGCKTSTSSLTPDFQYYKVFLPGFIITVTEAGYVHDKRSADLESTSNNQSHLHKTALLVL